MASQEALERKLREAQERQARWMRQRQAHLEKDQVEAELKQEYVSPAGAQAAAAPPAEGIERALRSASAAPPSSLQDNHYFKPEEIVTRLTERITDRLRNELRTELQNETSRASAAQAAENGRLEGYLASEIESHTCPICYELMVSPSRQPTLLFPCGHSFCAQCIGTHTKTHGKQTCPFCRQKISSKAPNVALQQLIQNFVSKKAMIRSSVGGAMDSPEWPKAGREGSRPATASPAASEDDGPVRWEREYRMLDMRCRVLQNEMVDTIQERRNCQARMESDRTVLQVFRAEEKEARARLEAAERALNHVLSNVQEQQAKLDKQSERFSGMEAKIDLIQRTLEPLEAEKEKLQLLLGNGS